MQLNAQFNLDNPCIEGENTISLNDQVTFQSNYSAQCNNCYDWDVPSGLSIIGSDEQQNVIIRGNAIGTYTISLTYFTEDGCKTCSKVINVLDCEEIPNNLGNTLVNNYLGSGNNYNGNIILNLPNGYDTSIIESIEWSLDSPSGYISINNNNVGNPYLSSPPVYSVDYVLNSEAQFGDDILFSVIVNFTSDSGCPPQLLTEKTRLDRSMNGISNVKKVSSVYPNPMESNSLFIEIKDVKNKNIELKLIDFGTGEDLYYLEKLNIETENITQKIILDDKLISSKIIILSVYENGGIIYSKKIIKK